ncbi:MAG: FAD-dependent oxidoreductase, partial [Acidobacteriota bacterium]
MTAPRFLIVGAGMVGAACADELAGEADVTVVEASRSLGGATAVSMGHVVMILDDSDAQLRLCRWSQRRWDSWADEMEADGDGVERRRCG